MDIWLRLIGIPNAFNKYGARSSAGNPARAIAARIFSPVCSAVSDMPIEKKSRICFGDSRETSMLPLGNC